jgi:hypothetical protein
MGNYREDTMPIDGGKRIVMKVFALAVMVSALLLFSKDSTKALFAPPHAPAGGAQLPTIIKADQEGAPLRIVDVLVETPGPERTVIRAVVQNQSDKKIRALAIAAGARVDFLNLMARASLLPPTHTRAVDIVYVGDGRPTQIALSVDFVEFDDDTTWGPDVGNSRDRLAGQREGAKAERRRLRSLLDSKGRQALIRLLAEDDSQSLESPGGADNSREWKDGYRGGAAAIRHRVRRALQTSDQGQVEMELKKAYDTSEGDSQ